MSRMRLAARSGADHHNLRPPAAAAQAQTGGAPSPVQKGEGSEPLANKNAPELSLRGIRFNRSDCDQK
jgi:hypothetical protein